MVLRVTCARECLKQIQVKERNALGHRDILGAIIAILVVGVLRKLRLHVWDDSSSPSVVDVLARLHIS